MAYFARKLRYGAHDGESGASYMALLELAKKKGGKPVGFVLYLRQIQYAHSYGYEKYPGSNEVKMIRLKAHSAEEAIVRFWPWEWDYDTYEYKPEYGKEFPGWESDRWEKTTLWLDFVAAGGGYEACGFYRDGLNKQERLFGRWTRVGTPAPWSKHRKKKLLQFGNLGHILRAHQLSIPALKEQQFELRRDLDELLSYDEDTDSMYLEEENREKHEAVEARMEAVQKEIAEVETLMAITRAEMRHNVRQMFPEPKGLRPKRDTRPKKRTPCYL
jgi:hypothetical protein